jgi:hypothetical protein
VLALRSHWFVAFVALGSSICAAADSGGVITCAGQKVVLFKDAIGAEESGNLSSPDGRYQALVKATADRTRELDAELKKSGPMALTIRALSKV